MTSLLLALMLTSSAADHQPLGKFKNTYYYYVDEAEYQHYKPNDKLRTPTGEILALVSNKFRLALDMEGSGKLRDGRMVNYAKVVNRRIRYNVTKHEFGRGVGNCALVPYRTIAVDPDKIPQGATVKIAETLGMLLPDGTIHDGVWKTDDIGGAIQENRIDIFTGDDRNGSYLSRAGIKHMQPLTISLISLPASDSCIYQQPE